MNIIAFHEKLWVVISDIKTNQEAHEKLRTSEPLIIILPYAQHP